jgi:hypothetical protein
MQILRAHYAPDSLSLQRNKQRFHMVETLSLHTDTVSCTNKMNIKRFI